MDKRSSRRPVVPLLVAFLVVGSVLAAQARTYAVTGSNFVVVDCDEQQRYRLFGLLPYTQTLAAQAASLLVCLFALAAAGLLLLLVLLPLLLHRGPLPFDGRVLSYDDWLPEPLARLVTAAHFEAAACASVCTDALLATMAVPVGLGRDLASLLAARTERSSSADSGSSSSYGSGFGNKRPSRAALKGEQQQQQQTQEQGGQYPGLYNTGNSCFLNSTLQSLAAVGRLERYLVAVEGLAEEWDVPTPVTDGLHDVLQQLNRRQKRQRAFVPTALTDALARLPRSNARSFLQAHQQQDAHELLVLVSSALDDERAAVLAERDAAIRAVTVGLGAAAIAPSSLPSSSSPHGISADAQSPFRGLVAQRTACMDCGYVEAVRHYASDELSLAVPARSGAVVRLETCLANWARLERVDWICHRCSLVATLARATADVARLSQAAAHSSSREKQKDKDYNNKSKNKGDKARKRKLKEATQREERLRSALQANLGEDDVEGSGLLADVRMERVMSQLATKHVMLARPPPLLVIHLNRSSYAAGAFGASKNNATVVFSEWLDVAPITTAGELDVRADQPISRSGTPGPDGPSYSSSSSSLPSPPPPQTLYRLCAIVVHYGGHSSGHYVSFRRRSPSPSSSSVSPDSELELDDDDDGVAAHRDEWSRISDADVQPCAPSDVFRQNPFLLFYERLDQSTARVGGHGQHARINGMANGMANGRAIGQENGRANGRADGSASGSAGGSAGGSALLAASVRERRVTPRVVQRWATSSRDLVHGRARENGSDGRQNGLDGQHRGTDGDVKLPISRVL